MTVNSNDYTVLTVVVTEANWTEVRAAVNAGFTKINAVTPAERETAQWEKIYRGLRAKQAEFLRFAYR